MLWKQKQKLNFAQAEKFWFFLNESFNEGLWQKNRNDLNIRDENVSLAGVASMVKSII